MKKKLFASMLSLAMAFILLTSSSFAWFSIATQGEIDEVTATMGATDILEIQKDDFSGEANETTANDSGNEFQYGNIVHYSEEGLNIDLPATVLEDGTFGTVGHDDDGRTNGVAAIDEDDIFTEATTGIKTYKSGDDVVGYGLCGYVRSNKTDDIYVDVDAEGLAYTVFIDDEALTGNKFSCDGESDYHFEVLIYFDGEEMYTPDTAGSGSISVLFTHTAPTA